jgi:hypothetical protein
MYNTKIWHSSYTKTTNGPLCQNMNLGRWYIFLKIWKGLCSTALSADLNWVECLWTGEHKAHGSLDGIGARWTWAPQRPVWDCGSVSVVGCDRSRMTRCGKKTDQWCCLPEWLLLTKRRWRGGRGDARRRSRCWGKWSTVHGELILLKKTGDVLRCFCVAASR